MQVFRLVISVARRHWSYLAIYLIVLTAASVMIGMWSSDAPEAGEASTIPTKVAVIDRDGSEISQALAQHTLSLGTEVEVPDSEFGLQDTVARDLASYVLVIPEGYGQLLMDAADAGESTPALEYVVSYQNARGALVASQVESYATALYGFSAATDADATQVIAWADESSAERANIESIGAPQHKTANQYLVYAAFSTYGIFCSIVVFLATGLAPLVGQDRRRRLAASPMTALGFGVQSGLACIVFGLFVWVVVSGVGLLAFGGTLAGTDPALVGSIVLMQLVYALFSTAVGFLLWRLHVGESYANAIGNIFGLLFSFLGGAWMSVDMLGEGFASVARFTPGYWAIDVATAVGESSAMTADLASRVAGDLGIVLLFAAAVLAAGLAVSRAKMRERSS